MATMASEYIPGTCNIGGAEAANRRRFGYGGTIATLVVGGVLALVEAPAALYLVLVLPAFVAATGFIQARSRFCAGYGMSGLSNFSDTLGASASTDDAAALAADRARARRITMQSLAIGILVAGLATALASIA